MAAVRKGNVIVSIHNTIVIGGNFFLPSGMDVDHTDA
jgi:hypothetical protein